MGPDSLRITNGVVYALSLVGGCILLYLGYFKGVCLDYSSEGDCEDYQASPTIVAYGFTALLISTLLFQIVDLFVDHVEESFHRQLDVIELLRKLNHLP